MQTALADFIRDTPEGREADSILRKCVHCGFCTATCPTYLLLGDENDGPRGRIYLMKQALEGQEITDRTRLHLDRCLTCRACETTCPSGVQYGRLLDIGRKLVEEKTARPAWERVKRRALAAVLPRRSLFALLLALGRLARPFLPERLAEKVPASAPAAALGPRHATLEKCSRLPAAYSLRSRPASTPPPPACSTESAFRSSKRKAPAAAARCASISATRKRALPTCAR